MKFAYDALPSSLQTHLRVQVCGNAERVGTQSHSLAHNTWRGRGACWSSGMGLGRSDQLIHSHGPAHNPHKVVSAKLEHLWCQDEPRATRTHKTHHGPDLGEATTFPLIVYSAARGGGGIQMAISPGTPEWESRICPRLESRDFGRRLQISPECRVRSRCGLNQSCSSRRELSNAVSHSQI